MKSLQPATREPLVMMVATAMLSALALVLFLLFEFPLLSAAPYLKMDFSDIPAIFGAVVFGPVCGVMVELIKNLLEMMVRGLGSQMGFGNIQNFLLGCAYLLPFTAIFAGLKKKNLSTFWRLILASLAGTVSMLVIGFFSNWAVAPLFFRFFLNNPLGSGEALAAAWISVPFNFIKGMILSVLMIPLLTLTLKPVRRVFGGFR